VILNMNYKKRMLKLKERLSQKEINTAVFFLPGNIFYYSGIETERPALLLIAEKFNHLILAESESGGIEKIFKGTITKYSDYSLEQIPEMFGGGLKRNKELFQEINEEGQIIGYDSDSLPVFLLKELDRVHLADISGDIMLQRSIKEEKEIKIIKNNLTILDNVMEAIDNVLQNNMNITEMDLLNLSLEIITKKNHGPFVWEGCLGSGARTSNSDVLPIEKIIKDGEQVLVDLFPSLRGYYGDITRTFIKGSPSSRHKEVYAVLKEALRVGERTLKPGAQAAVVDGEIRDFISGAGYGKYFNHHSGHGLGINAQEMPLLFPWSKGVINKGNVICIEPGIYIPGWGGMRIEQAYYITEDGPTPLSEFPFEI